jgi:cytochrome P450
MPISEEELTYPGPAGSEDPWPLLERLRAESPVFELPYRPGAYVVTRYEDVRFILGHPELFSSSSVRSQLSGFAIIDDPTTPDRAMNECDDPEHVGKRRIAFAPLKPGRLKTYEPMITELADGLIDDFVNEGRVEFVDSFAHPLPARLTCRLMGVPLEDEKFVRGWGRFESSGLAWMDDEFKARQRENGARMFEYLTELIGARRENPTDDVISSVIKEQVDRDGEFHLADVRAQCAILLGGGVVTTAHFFSSCMRLLVDDPNQMSRIRGDFRLIPNMIDEGLRLDPPTMWQPRRARQDVELGGCTVPKDSFLLMMFCSGNRDDRKFECPAHFDIGRPNAKDHLSFGYGSHFCLGAPLARIELRVGFERLLTRLKNIRFAPDNDFEHIASASFRGLRRLELEFDAA